LECARNEGDIEVFKWTGESEDCQLLSRDRIGAGGGGNGFGFLIEDDLSRGTSAPCLAYDNPCLVSSADGLFEVANIEIWAMTSFLLAVDAEQSETTLRFIHANMANSHGDKPSCAQSAWTNFL
jgi:hypothetical protein